MRLATVFLAHSRHLPDVITFPSLTTLILLQCCIRDHNFTGAGPDTSPCDKTNVFTILSQMLDSKVEYLWEIGDVFAARMFTGVRNWFLRGLPQAEGMLFKQQGLGEARKQFRWRGEEGEEDETSSTGVGLLLWSALSGNNRAVQELATSAAPDEALLIHRAELFSLAQKGTTPLHLAAAFASWAAVAALLESGYDPNATTIIG